MKRNIYLFNSLLRIYNKYRRKLINLRNANKNARRQHILEKHISRLFEKLSLLKMTIAQKTIAASIAIGALAFAPQTANAQSFAAKQINPFSLVDVNAQSTPTFADLDGDGDYDLLSGNDSGIYNYTTYANDYFFQYFENVGTVTNPVFAAPQTNPFGITSTNTEGELAPTFVDIDGDGDMDIVYGNYYSPMFYFLENTGTATSPAFAPAQINPFGLTDFTGSPYSSALSFADLDNDGDLDMITGEYYGEFYYFENTGTVTAPAFAAPILNPFGLYDIGGRSAPAFIDMDNDGDFDLISGERDGDFYYFENTGTASAPAFAAYQVNPFNLTFVGNSGYSAGRSKPTFVDLDNDGDIDLMAGDDYGDFNYYRRCAPTTSTITTTSACSYVSPAGQTLTTSGVYTNILQNTSGCDSIITINLTIESLADQTVTVANSIICGTGSTTINLGSSQNGVNYYLRDDSDDSVIDGPIAGNGSAISFNTNTISTPTTFNVYGEGVGPSTGLVFDGNDDYVDAGTGINLANSSFSIEFWAKKSVLSSGSDDHIIGLGDNTTQDNALHIGFRGGNQFTFAFFGNDLDAPSNLADTDWHHWAVTFDAVTKGRMIYRDGIAVAGGVSATNFLGTGNLKIGRAYTSVPFDNNQFAGSLDEVRVWSVSRTQSEIQSNMNTCLSGSETSLLAYYKFEDGAGSNTLADATTNANNGTLQNMDANAAWGAGSTVCSTCNLEMSQTVSITIGAAVDNTVNNSLSPTLSANQAGATYQWVDCNNSNAPIAGETAQTFTATASGSYAVEVTFNGCTATSTCETITVTGIAQASATAVSVYPNPTTGVVNINLGSNNSNVEYSITTIEGRVVESGRTTSNLIKIDLSKEGNGIYFLRINSDKTSTVQKLIKQ